MTILQAIVLGMVQGFAELLPISSSAHLVLTPWLFGWPDQGLAFDVALHVGTLAGVLWYFRREWIALAASALRVLRQRRAHTPEERRVVFLVLATIPGGIGGLLLNDFAERAFRSPALVATNLIVMGAVLWAVDRAAGMRRPLDGMRTRDALLIGLAQVLALVPGVSRSGSTMTAGRALGFDRSSAAVFSFLMSMPITAAAAIFKVPDALAQPGAGLPIVVGIVTAAVSSWLAIAFLLRYVSRHGFGIFAVYRFVLGATIFGLLYLRG